MTRRDFLWTASTAKVIPAFLPTPLIMPVHLVLDSRVKWKPEQLDRFWFHLWPQAVENLERCGIPLQCAQRPGQVSRTHRELVITGLEPGVINFIVTEQIPMAWDRGRALSGVTTRYRGYHLCMISLNHAHGHQIPLLSVNTCLHELLHALLGDILEDRPTGLSGEFREFRIDWYATRLWLLHDGAGIRESAKAYLERLRQDLAPPTPSAPSSYGAPRPALRSS